jgi:DNA-binding IclR family transcriptional regulator
MEAGKVKAGRPKPGGVPAVSKCLAVIRLLDADSGQGVTLAEIAGRLGLTKSHCLMILRTLVMEGWASHDPARQRYVLAPGLLLDVAATIRRHDHSALVHDVLLRLSQLIDLPTILCRVNRDGSFTCVDKILGGLPSVSGLTINIPIGHRFPSDAPAQMRARLAALPVERARALLEAIPVSSFTAATVTDKAVIWNEVQEARGRGFAIGRMEYLDGVMSIARAIRDAAGRVRMVLQCTGPQAALASRENAVGEAVLEAATRIALAWTMPSGEAEAVRMDGGQIPG